MQRKLADDGWSTEGLDRMTFLFLFLIYRLLLFDVSVVVVLLFCHVSAV